MSRRARRLTSLLALNRCCFLRLIETHPLAACLIFRSFTFELSKAQKPGVGLQRVGNLNHSQCTRLATNNKAATKKKGLDQAVQAF